MEQKKLLTKLTTKVSTRTMLLVALGLIIIGSVAFGAVPLAKKIAENKNTICYRNVSIYTTYNAVAKKNVWTKGVGSSQATSIQGYNTVQQAQAYVDSLIKMGYKFKQCVLITPPYTPPYTQPYTYTPPYTTPYSPSYNASNYDYRVIYQSPYSATMKIGSVRNVWVEVKNTGKRTWYSWGDNIVRLGSGSMYGAPYQQRGYYSEFANSDWLSPDRPTTMANSAVMPGWHTRFQFNLKAPMTPGLYRAYFTLVVDGFSGGWMKDIGMFWQINVVK